LLVRGDVRVGREESYSKCIRCGIELGASGAAKACVVRRLRKLEAFE